MFDAYVKSRSGIPSAQRNENGQIWLCLENEAKPYVCRNWQSDFASFWRVLTEAAYSGQGDRPFWPIVTAAHAMVLRG